MKIVLGNGGMAVGVSGRTVNFNKMNCCKRLGEYCDDNDKSCDALSIEFTNIESVDLMIERLNWIKKVLLREGDYAKLEMVEED